MFTVTAVAFAEDGNEGGGSDKPTTPAREVTFDAEKFAEYVFDGPASIEMSTTFMFDGKITVDEKEVVWFKDYKVLHEIFDGINYIELKDEEKVVAEDDDDYASTTKYKLTYDYNLDELKIDGDKPTEPEAKEYQATQHVKLGSAPAVDGYLFAGWEISFTAENKAPEFESFENFPSSFVFNMPAAEVTVKAHWVEKAKEGETQPEITFYANDVIYVLYSSSDSRETMDKWESCPVTNSFSVTTKGWWNFRFAVADGVNVSKKDHSLDWDKDILATTYDNVQAKITEREESNQPFDDDFEKELEKIDYTLRRWAEDTTHPKIKLSSAMEDKMLEGLTVGKSYTISTALTIEDASSDTLVNYEVFKKVGNVDGADKDGWLSIYNSETGKVTEGYEDCISGGVITPLEKDVTGDYIYKIVYSVVDGNGYFGVDEDATKLEEYHPEMLLKVYRAVVEPGSRAIQAWKIVLYVIAGLSAVGIVVLLCIKPKQAVANDGRYTASANEDTAGSSDGTDKEE